METHEELCHTFANDADTMVGSAANVAVTVANAELFRQNTIVTPLLIRDNNYQQNYDPSRFSLGPYHYGKEKLRPAAGSSRDAGLLNPQTCDDAVNSQIAVETLPTADATPSGNQCLERRMQKVPPFLRRDKNHQEDYDPLVVSFGPYHHGKEVLRSAEDFKLKALQMFVVGSGQDAEFFQSQILEHIDYARNCYIEGSTEEYNNAAFARMMLLDACFIINFILLTKVSEENIRLTRYHLGDFVRETVFRDMFILENQIPFRILKHLMCLRYEQQEGEKMLNEFLTTTVFGECKESEIASRRDEDLPLHLLEACRLVLVAESYNSKDKPTTPQGPQPISSNGSQSGCLKHMGNSVKCSHLVQHIFNLPCFPWRKEKDNRKSMKKYIHCFRSATDLKAKGIHFRPSTTDSLRGIEFKPGCFYALLEVPTCFVTYDTKVFFSNIIAYELCPSAIITDPVVTSYIEFMKLLIDNPKDVKELREKKILLPTIGSDEEVVKVYKEINTYGVRNVFTFHNVKEEIQAHYNNKVKTWLAELIYTYFRSPWSARALFAATFLLVLTFLQTYYTVRPS